LLVVSFVILLLIVISKSLVKGEGLGVDLLMLGFLVGLRSFSNVVTEPAHTRQWPEKNGKSNKNGFNAYSS
jgi:hypothetical protein